VPSSNLHMKGLFREGGLEKKKKKIRVQALRACPYRGPRVEAFLRSRTRGKTGGENPLLQRLRRLVSPTSGQGRTSASARAHLSRGTGLTRVSLERGRARREGEPGKEKKKKKPNRGGCDFFPTESCTRRGKNGRTQGGGESGKGNPVPSSSSYCGFSPSLTGRRIALEDRSPFLFFLPRRRNEKMWLAVYLSGARCRMFVKKVKRKRGALVLLFRSGALPIPIGKGGGGCEMDAARGKTPGVALRYGVECDWAAFRPRNKRGKKWQRGGRATLPVESLPGKGQIPGG